MGHRTGRGFSQGQLVGSSNAPLKTSQFILRALGSHPGVSVRRVTGSHVLFKKIPLDAPWRRDWEEQD